MDTIDNPLFCLADVCKSLELHSNVVRQRLTDDVCSTYPIVDSIGRTQQATFITEDGLYDVILDSRKPEAKVFSYQGTSVTFIHKDGKVMVNATEMAKPFGDSKRAKNWLTLNATNEFLNILSKGRNLPLADLVRVTKGGNNPGT